eukprot:scaffold78864_cov54-Phaeocystis_antarctica.AAC.4
MAAGRREDWRGARARAPRPHAAAREARPPGRPMQLTPSAPPAIQQHAPARHRAATLRVRLVGRNERRAAAACGPVVRRSENTQNSCHENARWGGKWPGPSVKPMDLSRRPAD